MPKLHICQDETTFWQLTFEDDDGNLTLISHHFPSPEHLIDDARDLVAKGRVPNAEIIVGTPTADVPAHETDGPYSKPAPRRAVV